MGFKDGTMNVKAEDPAAVDEHVWVPPNADSKEKWLAGGSYLVARRTHEIGIRLAVGADRTQVLIMVLKQGVTLAGAGIGWWASRRVLRPLRGIGDAAHAIATGRLETRVEASTDADLALTRGRILLGEPLPWWHTRG